MQTKQFDDENLQRKDLPFCPKLAWLGKTDSSEQRELEFLKGTL